MDWNPEGEIEESPAALVKRLGLPFSNYLLLSRALTHRSYINEHPEAVEDNERLEFLGDAVLDFMSGAWLYNHFPEMAEGELTRMRSALVRTEQLAEFARSLSLGAAMRLGRGMIVAHGRDRDVLLCGTFEALVGAIYLQAGIEATSQFIHPFLENAARFMVRDTEKLDPKSRLQEWSQARRFGIPQYRIVQTSGPDHEKVFEVDVHIQEAVCGHGCGPSKAVAARRAAQNALDVLNKNPDMIGSL